MQVERKSDGKTYRLFPKSILAALALGAVMLMSGFGGTSPAQAQDAEYACRQDAFRLCSQYIPNEGAVKGCMRRNARSLSPVCRAEFVRGGKRARRHARHHRHHSRHHRKHHRRHR
jgi:hypothetical protein